MSPTAIAVTGVVFAVLLAALVGFAAGFLGAFFGVHVVPTLPDRITVIPPTTQEPVAAAAAAALGLGREHRRHRGQQRHRERSSRPDTRTFPCRATAPGSLSSAAPDGGTYILTNNHVVAGREGHHRDGLQRDPSERRRRRGRP